MSSDDFYDSDDLPEQNNKNNDVEYIEIKLKKKESEYKPSKNKNVPVFLSCGFDISLYIRNMMENLIQIREENNNNNMWFSLEFQSFFQDLINNSSKCYHSIIALYDILFAIVNEIEKTKNFEKWEKESKTYIIKEAKPKETKTHQTVKGILIQPDSNCTQDIQDSEGTQSNQDTNGAAGKIQDYLVEFEEIEKLNIHQLVGKIAQVFEEEEEIFDILSSYSFNNFFEMILLDLRRMHSSMINCSCHLFSLLENKNPKQKYNNFLERLSGQIPKAFEDASNNKNPEKEKRREKNHDKIFNVSVYLKFVFIKNSFNKFLRKYFDAFNIAFIRERFDNLLMPGVFYEYILFNDLETKNKIHFHSLQQEKISSLSNFSMIDLDGNIIEVKFVFQENINQIQYNGEMIKFYTDFNVICSYEKLNNHFVLSCESTADVNSKIIRYNDKTIGNTSKGFWIRFKDTKFYFKELYCNTRHYIKNMSYILDKNETNKDLETLKFGKNEYNIKSTEIETLSSRFPMLNMPENENIYYDNLKYSIEKILMSIEESDYYHINQYVELSGYFLLNTLGKIPDVNAFYSKIYGNPIIGIKEIDAKYNLVKSTIDQSTLQRIKFDHIINDMFSVFISSIHELRLIQRIFLIDDFHEENVAISLKTTQQDQNKIQYIDGIQIIDLWPTVIQMDNDYLFKPKDKSSCFNINSFDDLIMTMLFEIWNLTETKYSRGEVINNYFSIDVIQEAMCDVEKAEIQKRNKQIMNNKFQLSDDTKIEIYGDWILDFPFVRDDHKNPFYIITLFAMIDLFDNIFNTNKIKFSKYESKYCENIALDLLGESYGKATQVIPKISNYDSESIKSLHKNKSAAMSDDANVKMWSKYLDHVAITIESIIFRLSTMPFLNKVKYSKKAKRIRIITQENENNFEFLNCNSSDLFTDISFRHQFIGIIIYKGYKDNELTKYLDEFEFHRIYSEAMNSKDFLPKLYIIESPVMFDVALENMNSYQYRLKSNYKKVYYIPR